MESEKEKQSKEEKKRSSAWPGLDAYAQVCVFVCTSECASVSVLNVFGFTRWCASKSVYLSDFSKEM